MLNTARVRTRMAKSRPKARRRGGRGAFIPEGFFGVPSCSPFYIAASRWVSREL